MTRKFQTKTDSKILKVLPGETFESLKARMILQQLSSGTSGMKMYSIIKKTGTK